jgi:hypothetical protein
MLTDSEFIAAAELVQRAGGSPDPETQRRAKLEAKRAAKARAFGRWLVKGPPMNRHARRARGMK